MDSTEALSDRKLPRVLNPIWIISLFVGVSETVIGVATTQTSGWVQGLFAVAAILFPLGFSAAFFATVWLKPDVLYAPADCPGHFSVSDFADGAHRQALSSLDVVGPVVRDALETVLPQLLATQMPTRSVEQVVSAAVFGVQNDLESRAIKINPQLLSPNLDNFEVIFDAAMTVDSLLDIIWSDLRAYVQPFTYTTQWVLVNRRTLTALDQIGTRWAKRHSLRRDERLLQEVGIEPGTELIVIRPGQGQLDRVEGMMALTRQPPADYPAASAVY